MVPGQPADGKYPGQEASSIDHERFWKEATPGVTVSGSVTTNNACCKSEIYNTNWGSRSCLLGKRHNAAEYVEP